MMLVLLLTVVIIAIAMGAMAIGVAVNGRRLKGSCGGVGDACDCIRKGIEPNGRTCGRVH